jgi:hypothetical protein
VAASRIGGFWGRSVPPFAMLCGVLAWLWPIGLGGRMLVGGDVTQFSMGLMGFLRASIRAGRLPLWNDLWGFGFPGLAESQMGVFYPPHLLLYGVLSTEVAYVTSLVLHTLWGALGTYWAARRFGISGVGSALAGFAWATCGFFLIHLSHQWGYTVGSWMPWAWGLSWQVIRGSGSRRTPWLLSAVLALQVLPGHFQLAFVTEVGCLALAMVEGGRSVGRRAAVILALAAMIPLSAMQLWPTYRLARLSDSRRDFEYLSGFAVTPIHLVSFAAPGLFHRSPLWRPVAWDPFHTSPEELLQYVGLVPLFLAVGAIARGWRADPGIRALTILAGLTLLLSLGPYAPGFEWLIRLPGFSFFRAPARWGLATSLALALLAGRGFDFLREWPRLGRSVGRFALACVAWVLLVILGFEMALVASKGDDWKSIAWGYDRALKHLPWADRPGVKSFRELMADARRPRTDLRARMELARLYGRQAPPPAPSLEVQRLALYGSELGEAGALLVAFLMAGGLVSRPRAFAGALLTIALADSLILARHRPFDFGPIRPLVDQSPVLARMAQEPRGTRTLDPSRNLFMLAGVDVIWAYRTLDLPAPIGLIQHTWGRTAGPQATVPMRIVGADARLLDPLESKDLTPELLEPWWGKVEEFHDQAMAGWSFGVDFARSSGHQKFILVHPHFPAARAWLLPSKGLEEADGMVDMVVLLEKFRTATPLPHRSDSPERVEVTATVTTAVPSMVVLTTTYDPEWRAWLVGPSGERRPAEVVKVLGGWQGVAIPEPGRWTVHLEYPGRAVWVGIAVSAVAWLIWMATFLGLGTRRRSPEPVVVEANSEGGT